MTLIQSLRTRRDKIQGQLDRWIARGFKGKTPSQDPTPKETAGKVAEVADIHHKIAEHNKAANPDATRS
jgi:hypothetical protein